MEVSPVEVFEILQQSFRPKFPVKQMKGRSLHNTRKIPSKERDVFQIQIRHSPHFASFMANAFMAVLNPGD
jgi:hypothetical protein